MIDQALSSILLGASSVTTLVGTKVFAGQVPQDKDIPLIVFSKIGGSGRELHHSGVVGWVDSRFSIDCQAVTAEKAKELAAAVVALIHGYSGTAQGTAIAFAKVENELDLYESEAEVFRVAVDVMFRHRG